MKCVVYVSQENISFDEQLLTELAESSSNRNAESGITGYLYYDRGYFTQYIEGSPGSIDGLLGALNRDPQHSILATYEDSTDERRFASWHMKKLVRNDLIEIQLEHVLTDHLLFLNRVPGTIDLDPERLWRMVDTLVRLQNRIPE